MKMKHIERIKAGYPHFSWDRVPLYAHLGIGDGLEPDQINFLADRFKLIAFTGGRITRGSLEQNIAAAARAIKERNPQAKVLFYWASDIPKGQWRASNANFPKDGYVRPAVAGSMKGEKSFDVTKPAVRDWWTGVAAKAVTEYSCDGIFVDGATAGAPGEAWAGLFGKERAAELEAGMFTMLQEAKERMGANSLIVFNPLHGDDGEHGALGEDYLPVTDGAMVDDFDRGANIRRQSNQYIANTIETMGKAATDGKVIIFKAWPGFTWWSDKEMIKRPHDEIHRVARESITFPLASFLIGAREHCYFCYTWGWLAEYGTFDWYPEFDRPLGAPKGDAVQTGWTFRRDFEHAAVFVDIEKRIGNIDWTSPTAERPLGAAEREDDRR
jgi:hypothetical protein